jgi:hypothetical protein
MFDTTSTSLGIGVTGTDHPSSNLYITGNAYVTSDIGIGGVLTMGTVNVVARHDLESVTATGNTTPLTVEFQNADTSLVASGNVEVGKELTVTGNTTVSSNLTVSGNVTVDTNTLHVDATNNRVGVGTTNPNVLLELSSDTGSATIVPTELRLSSSTNATDWDTTNPYARLAFYTEDVTADAPGVMASIGAVASSVDGGENTRLAFFTAEPHDERMCIDRYGNVGINTTTPQYRLDVNTGNDIMLRLMASAGSTGKLILGRSGNQDLRSHAIEVTNNSGSQNNSMKFMIHDGTGTAPYETRTEVMTLVGNGRVGIGTNAPSFPLQVLGKHGLDEDGYWAKYKVGTSHPDGTTRIYFRDFSDSDNVVMSVNHLSSANDASDDRIKTDEVLVENATQTLLKLKPQTYTKDIFEFDELTSEEYSNTETLTDGYVFSPTHDRWRKRRFAGRPRKETGLIIQDIWYDAPELRHIIRLADDAEPTEERPETEDIQQDPDYDSLGWGQDASHLMYQQIIPYLIKSNQELHARIQALENAS